VIGVGIVGCNYGRTVLLPAFRTDPRCEVVALAGTDAARTAELARAVGVRSRSGRRRDESKNLQQRAHREHAFICNGTRPDWICLRPDSLLPDRRRGLRSVLKLGNYNVFDGRAGLHDGKFAANGVDRWRRQRIRGHAKCDPSLRIPLSATPRQHAKFRKRRPGNLQRPCVQSDRSGRAEL
jgi:hypothetical protein